MDKLPWYVWVVIILLFLTAILVSFPKKPVDLPPSDQVKVSISTFDECVKAGNPIMESYPRQCRAGEQTFVEEIENGLNKSYYIRLDEPVSNQKIKSPLTVEGEARGTWYFEATFPLYLLDSEGNEIARGIAQAEGDWMTEEFVPFKATLEFDVIGGSGVLVLEKSNPSGLAENSDELRVPVQF